MNRYILVDKVPVLEPDLMKWGSFLETEERRRVALDEVDNVMVSTVFLGIDHGWGGQPVLFETMIFGGEHDQYQERYHTWEEAEEGHKRAMELVKSSNDNNLNFMNNSKDLAASFEKLKQSMKEEQDKDDYAKTMAIDMLKYLADKGAMAMKDDEGYYVKERGVCYSLENYFDRFI